MNIMQRKAVLVKQAKEQEGYIMPCFSKETHSPFTEEPEINVLCFWFQKQIEAGITTSCVSCKLKGGNK